MNVSFVLASLSRNAGGLFESGRRLGQELHRLPDTHVSVIGLRDEFTAADAPLWDPLTVAPCTQRGPRILGWAPGHARALARQYPDLVHQHGIWTLGSFETTRFCRAARLPLVVSMHGMIEPWALEHSRWKKRAAWLAYQADNLRYASCIVVTSKAEASYVRDCKITTPIAVIPNGVDRLTKTTTAPAWQSVLGGQRRVLLFLGRLHPKKGVFELMQAWARFIEGDPSRAQNWSLVLTGWDDGGHHAKLRDLAHNLGLRPPTFHMTGPLFGPQRDAALSHAHGFILPSHGEGMPLAALEALAIGVPPLLTDACNLPQVAEAGAGLRIGPTASEICEGIVQFSALTRDQHNSMAQQARRLAEGVFSWPNAARDTSRIYAWLLGQGPRPVDLLV